MTLILITMIAVLLIAGIVAGMVMVGMEGRGTDRAPKVSRQLTRAAKHLNGDAKPPKRFVRAVESSLTR